MHEKGKKKVTEAEVADLSIPNTQDSIKNYWNHLTKRFNLCRHHEEYKGVGWEFVIDFHSVDSKRLRSIAEKHNLTVEQIFKLEQMFLHEYLPNELINLFSRYDWIFDWKMVGANKRWIVLIDRELSQYYSEKENKLDLYSFNENDLKRMKNMLKTRYRQLTKVKKHIHETLDGYGNKFCSYLETKLG